MCSSRPLLGSRRLIFFVRDSRELGESSLKARDLSGWARWRTRRGEEQDPSRDESAVVYNCNKTGENQLYMYRLKDGSTIRVSANKTQTMHIHAVRKLRSRLPLNLSHWRIGFFLRRCLAYRRGRDSAETEKHDICAWLDDLK